MAVQFVSTFHKENRETVLEEADTEVTEDLAATVVIVTVTLAVMIEVIEVIEVIATVNLAPVIDTSHMAVPKVTHFDPDPLTLPTTLYLRWLETLGTNGK